MFTVFASLLLLYYCTVASVIVDCLLIVGSCYCDYYHRFISFPVLLKLLYQPIVP